MFPIWALDDMRRAVSREHLSIAPLITARYSLEHADEAWGSFVAGSLGKTVISWV